jgi:hypothetical protein
MLHDNFWLCHVSNFPLSKCHHVKCWNWTMLIFLIIYYIKSFIYKNQVFPCGKIWLKNVLKSMVNISFIKKFCPKTYYVDKWQLVLRLFISCQKMVSNCKHYMLITRLKCICWPHISSMENVLTSRQVMICD